MVRIELPEHDVVGIRADNPGPFTLAGTNSWIVGRDRTWLVDPGPAIEAHTRALVDEIGARGGLAGIPEPRVVVPMVLAGVLLLTSVPIQLASRAVREGRLRATRLLLLPALVVQAGYLAYEIQDFGDQLRAFGIARNAYSSIYYTLLGADHAHVAVGLLLDAWLLAKLARGLTRYRVTAMVAIAWYWHFVNVLTVVVIGTLTSVNVV